MPGLVNCETHTNKESLEEFDLPILSAHIPKKVYLEAQKVEVLFYLSNWHQGLCEERMALNKPVLVFLKRPERLGSHSLTMESSLI